MARLLSFERQDITTTKEITGPILDLLEERETLSSASMGEQYKDVLNNRNLRFPTHKENDLLL